MGLSEYSDDELIEAHFEPLGKWAMGLKKISIGGIVFELRT
jgi:hypothetical protein